MPNALCPPVVAMIFSLTYRGWVVSHLGPFCEPVKNVPKKTWTGKLLIDVSKRFRGGFAPFKYGSNLVKEITVHILRDFMTSCKA